MKVHIAPIFFIPIISYRVRGGTIYALIIKSLCCSDYFFLQRITLNSTFIQTSLIKQQRFFFNLKKRKKEKPTVTEVTIFKRCQNNRIQQIFSHLFSMFSINQHALQNEIKSNNEEQFHTSSSGTLKILVDKIIYRVKTWLINTPPHYIYLLRYHCASSKIHKTFAFIALELC